MMSLTFGLFTQVSGSGPLGPLVNVMGKAVSGELPLDQVLSFKSRPHVRRALTSREAKKEFHKISQKLFPLNWQTKYRGKFASYRPIGVNWYRQSLVRM